MKVKPGATGDFPDGSFGPHDKGGVVMGVSHDSKGNVHLDFGNTDVNWLAMPKEMAIEFAKNILRHAGAKKVEIEF